MNEEKMINMLKDVNRISVIKTEEGNYIVDNAGETSKYSSLLDLIRDFGYGEVEDLHRAYEEQAI